MHILEDEVRDPQLESRAKVKYKTHREVEAHAHHIEDKPWENKKLSNDEEATAKLGVQGFYVKAAMSHMPSR